jgi:hypothetical protein
MKTLKINTISTILRIHVVIKSSKGKFLVKLIDGTGYKAQTVSSLKEAEEIFERFSKEAGEM